MQPTMARDGMRYWRMRPHPNLQRWVVCYYLVEPDPNAPAIADRVIERQLILPDGHAEIVFTLAGGFERWRVDSSSGRKQMSRSYLIGGRSHSVHTVAFDSLRLAGIKLRPQALRTLIDVPLGEFRDATLALAELNCKALCDIEDAVAGARSPTALCAILDEFLLRTLRKAVAHDSMVEGLIASTERLRGSIQIFQWAREQRVADRTLERRFIATMGITPKQFARIVRFKHSYLQFLAGGRQGNRYLDGYYDQSHFDREFATFLGVTPTAILARAAQFRTTVSDHLLQSEFEP